MRDFFAQRESYTIGELTVFISLFGVLTALAVCLEHWGLELLRLAVVMWFALIGRKEEI